MTKPAHIGAFELIRPLGKGGMGEVWLGRHNTQGTAVAIKLISPEHSATENYQHAFQLEVQAVARLNHPSICHVLDFGHTTQTCNPTPKHTIHAQTPWLAMALYSGGSLEERRHQFTYWPQLKRCIVQLLDALAHAHARGTIHRDLKPGNVLIKPHPHDLRYVLTDFGLAHPTTRNLSKRTQAFFAQTVGTPYYMPPEQIEGRWRDFGPWTDLYALGCMAFELIHGAPPFLGSSAIEVVKKHLQDPPPKLKPRFVVPEGLEQWLHQLMAKHPSGRFERAADALLALLALDPETDLGPALTTLYEHTSEPLCEDALQGPETVKLQTQTLEILISQDQRTQLATTIQAPNAAYAETHHVHAGVPESWRLPQPEEALELLNVGLGLFSMREVPFVGREAERDLIWDALKRCTNASKPQLVVVQGPAGTGKSRLVEWVAQRAEELGAATLFPIAYRSDAPSHMAMIEAIRTYLRCADLDYQQAYKRILAMLQSKLAGQQLPPRTIEFGAISLGALICNDEQPNIETSSGATTLPRITFSNHRERQLATMPLFLALATNRPLIVWLDDVHYSPEDLEFVIELLDRPEASNLPTLIITTMRSDDPALQSRQTQLNAKIERHPRAQQLTLGPLNPREHRTFLRRLLPLEPKLQEEVATRTEGNPLFALQLVRDWVNRGELIAGERGFWRADQNNLEIPDSVHALWRTRVEHLKAQGWPFAPEALELAAAYGQPLIPAVNWQRLCHLCGYTPTDGLLEALAQQGLIKLDGAGWSFAHRMLQESMIRQAKERDRWSKHHRTWANWMQNIPNPSSRHWLVSLSYHFIEAQRYKETRQAAQRAADLSLEQSDYALALEALNRYAASCDAEGLAQHDPERIKLWPMQAEVLRFMGRIHEANALIQRTIDLTDDQGPNKTRADALRLMASSHMLGQNAALAQAYSHRAIALYEQLNDRRGLIDALHTQGWFALNTQQYELALQTFERGTHLALAEGALRLQAWCQQGLTELNIRSLDLHRARHSANQCMLLFEQLGARAGIGTTLGNFAEIELLEGNGAQAWERATASLELLEQIGSALRLYPIIILSLLDLLSGFGQQSMDRIKPWLPTTPPEGHYVMHTMLHLLMVAGKLSVHDYKGAAHQRDQLLSTLYQRPVSIALYMLPTHTIISELGRLPAPERRGYLLLIELLLKHLKPDHVRARFNAEFGKTLAALLR